MVYDHHRDIVQNLEIRRSADPPKIGKRRYHPVKK